jgi:two-component system chemotaxis response regulator CheB
MAFFIVVIGASAGGQEAVCKLIAAMPKELNAAIFIVLHVSRNGLTNFLTTRLQKCTSLQCSPAAEGQVIQKGHIYIAPVDHHLILKAGTMHLRRGPAENRWRPSIDVLFRSAAVYYGQHVIGIILTGLLDDGTSGMQAIKKCGGTCIVQDPGEASYPDMPQSVLDNTMVDYVLPVTGMADAIEETIATKTITGLQAPAAITAEVQLIEKTITAIEDVSKLGSHTVYTCPDCGGGLWETTDGEHTRYRCHIGHAYSESDLLKKQFESLNATLWVALRMMEERKNLLNKISRQDQSKNLHTLVKLHTERARELEIHINNLKELLFNIKPDD